MKAKLKPSVIRAGALSLQLGYGPSGCIQELSISGITSQVDHATKAHWFLTQVQCDHGWLTSGPALNPLFFRAIAWKENHFTPTRCTLKDFVLHQNYFWRQLFGNPSLKSLKMENFVLMSCEDMTEDPLEAIMGLFKARALDATIPVLKVTMINIAKEYYDGMVSINDAEVNRWIKDQDSDWLATTQGSFTPFPEYSDTEDSSDNEPYSGLHRYNRYSSDLESEEESEAGSSEHGADNTNDLDGGLSHTQVQ